MKQENHPKEVRSNDRGANQDIDKEILGANPKSGEYLEGRNLRVSSINSARSSADKISGEEIVHQNVQTGDWVSICVSSINNKKVEFWVDRNVVEDPIIMVDGVIVAQSDKLPFLATFPIQHDKNESCVGGEIFVTDFNAVPMTFNIQDMVDSLISNPTKYFADFNPSLYTVNLETPLNIPVFVELVNLGGSSGLPIGSYIYSLRYVTVDGDRTDWTPATPPIPVLNNVSTEGSQPYPYVKTFGADPNPSVKTNYGIKIRFRVNNPSNFDFIEIRRQSYNLGLSNVLTPNSVLVAKIDISDGEISVREFIDPKDSNVNDAISEEDEVNKLASIKRAKGIRYHDKRLVLMNIEFESKEVDNVTFVDLNGVNAVPVVKKLGKIGYKDPYNHTYNKRYMSGERCGFSAVFFGATAGTSFAMPIPGLENFQFPNRRDALSADSKLYSYLGAARTATASGSVDETFEVFDLEDAVRKPDYCSFKNILNEGSKSRSQVSTPGCSISGLNPTVNSSAIGYQPFKPVSPIDMDLSGLSYRVNTGVKTGGGDRNYDPLGYAPNYYSMGLAVGGIRNIPSWVKGFSIARTEMAKRVIMQGLGVYSLNQGVINDFGLTTVAAAPFTKNTNKLWFYSPDSDIIDQNLINDIKANPLDYKVQLVSPLGFFSNVYNFDDKYDSPDSPFNNDRSVDMITYARVLHDEGQINTDEWVGMGVASGGKNYVGHNKYRNVDAASGGAFSGDGNKLFDLKSFSAKTDGRSSYFELEFNQAIYNTPSMPLGGANFNDFPAKQFHEPFYIVNIIKEGANISNLNIDNYKSTGHFQKIESIIGKGNSLANQSFQLVDERWEDCIPDLSSTGSFANTFAYLYLVNALGISKTWMNVTYRSLVDITTITNDIINNGFHIPEPGVQVYGIYTHTNNNNRWFTIEFNIPSFYPTALDTITIKYNDSRPLSVFGGDTVVAENLFCPIDRINLMDGDKSPENQFVLNGGFPFASYQPAPRYFIPRNNPTPTDFTNPIETEWFCNTAYVRQLLFMFSCETRKASNFSHGLASSATNQYYPLVNYVMRPSNLFPLGDVFSAYHSDYIGEQGIWGYGGFRFHPRTNIDYSYDGPLQYFARPDFGFKEETHFCTAVIWSLSRAVNVQDSPGLKTFISLNRIDIADDQGAIKKAYDATTGGKGENLYAITEKGVCLLLTKKSILSSISADDLSTVASDQFISSEYWLSKQIGSNDEMWRGMGERTIGFLTDDGMIEKEVLFFINKQSVYTLVENQIKDIGRNKYYSRLRPFLKGLKAGYTGFLAAVINKNNNEFWLDIENGDNNDRKLFVYGNENAMWEGYFDYKFDQYYMSENKMFGTRDLQTFEIGKGFKINGIDIAFELTTIFSPGNISVEKEFIRIGVQTGRRGQMKPTRIEFYDIDMNMLCSLSQFSQGTMFLKQYDAWEQFIGRKDAVVSYNRYRVQERTLIVKIIHSEPEDFRVVTTTIQYKIIK